MQFVTDIRRAGIELDVRDFVRELRRRARWYLPKGASRVTINAVVARRLEDGDVSMPAGLELPSYLALVESRQHFGVAYFWRCPGCWRRRRFLYRWPGEYAWRCRGCRGLRYSSQAMARLGSLRRVILGHYELDDLEQRLKALEGRVGRPRTKTRQRLQVRRHRWSERMGEALERVPI
jgi:hypothetical protein